MASLITWAMNDGSYIYRFVTFNARFLILYPFIFFVAYPFFLALSLSPVLGCGNFDFSESFKLDRSAPMSGDHGVVATLLDGFLDFLALWIDFAPAVFSSAYWVLKVIDGLAADVKMGKLTPWDTALHLMSLIEYGWENVFKYVDDRKLRQEDLLVWCCRLPPAPRNSTFRPLLEYAIVSNLWNALPHPIGNWAHYALGGQYRKADGSHNNLSLADIGKAHGRLIRDVTSPVHDAKEAPQTELFDGSGKLPDAKDVFDKILKRRDFTKHPSGISANFFYNATLITHDLFNSKNSDQSINKTTSYADMSWLYGWTAHMQQSVRWNEWVEKIMKEEPDLSKNTKKETDEAKVSYLKNEEMPKWMQDWVLDKKNRNKHMSTPERVPIQNWIMGHNAFHGKLYPDVFADRRLIVQPPGLVSYALLWARNHNWIAEQLVLNATDDTRFASKPNTIAEWEKYDEDLFQVARNINVMTFVQAIVRDYVRTILALYREDSIWTVPIPKDFSMMPKDIPQATGNQCSIEFNFIYRWHSAISQDDAAWAEVAIHALMKNKPGVPTPDEFSKAMHSRHRNRELEDPRVRDYFDNQNGALPNMERTDSGKYPDEILAEKLKASRKMPAGAFGGTQIPAIFEPIEILGIEHGRKIGVCTLNEYRKFLGLRPFKDFNEMNPKLANELKELYKKVDNVELYPGIVAEEAKPAGPAAGLCTGYTATFAILSDAIALVRGDRFLTMDANPYNLTNWGVAETTPDLKKHFGNILGIKLFNRHLDNARLKDLGLSFPLDDIHTHYMFSTPEEIQKYISLLRKGEKPQEIRKPKRMVDHQNRPLMSEATGPGSNGVLRGAVGIDGIRTA